MKFIKCILLTIFVVTVASCSKKAEAELQKTGDATKQGAVKAYDATKKGSVETYDASKQGAVKAYDASKQGAVGAYDNLKEKVSD